MSGLKKLLDSYKSMAFAVCVIVVGVLVGLGKADYVQLVDFMKWGLGFVVGARSIEEGMKGLGKGRPISIPTISVLPAGDDGPGHITVTDTES